MEGPKKQVDAVTKFRFGVAKVQGDTVQRCASFLLPFLCRQDRGRSKGWGLEQAMKGMVPLQIRVKGVILSIEDEPIFRQDRLRAGRNVVDRLIRGTRMCIGDAFVCMIDLDDSKQGSHYMDAGLAPRRASFVKLEQFHDRGLNGRDERWW